MPEPCDNNSASNRDPPVDALGSELIAIFKLDYFSLPGGDHMRSGRDNEDRISVRTHRAVTAAVLCDGAGSFGSGAEAAELTADALTRLLIRRFDALYKAPGDEVRLSAIQTIERTLHNYSRRTGIPARELACTILAAAVHADGRCICLHLGDGIILQKNGADGDYSVVSSPMNGLAPHSTYLTMNCDLGRYLRLYRWETADLDRLMLLSDGAAEHLVRLSGGAGWVYTGSPGSGISALREGLIEKHPRDDCSTVLISRAGA